MFENGIFDASTVAPSQGGGKVSPGNYDAYISNTYGKPTKDQTGGMIVVEFTTPNGAIEKRYNVWNASPQAVEIASKEISALCHATGIFKITANQNDLPNAVRELRNARCKIIVGYQSGMEPSAERPEGGYTEVKKVLDLHGNEPGKTNAQNNAAPQQNQAPQNALTAPPMQQNAGGSWGTPNAGNAAPSQPQAGWNSGQAQANPAPAQTGQAWSPGNAGGNGNPPWKT